VTLVVNQNRPSIVRLPVQPRKGPLRFAPFEPLTRPNWRRAISGIAPLSSPREAEEVARAARRRGPVRQTSRKWQESTPSALRAPPPLRGARTTANRAPSDWGSQGFKRSAAKWPLTAPIRYPHNHPALWDRQSLHQNASRPALSLVKFASYQPFFRSLFVAEWLISIVGD
jgi:hypothetical protein